MRGVGGGGEGEGGGGGGRGRRTVASRAGTRGARCADSHWRGGSGRAGTAERSIEIESSGGGPVDKYHRLRSALAMASTPRRLLPPPLASARL